MSLEDKCKEIHDLLEQKDPELTADQLIDSIVPLTEDEKHSIAEKYKSLYGADIDEDINSKLEGTRFALSLAELFTPRVDSCCKQIKKRINYYIADEDVIFEIICGSPGWLIEAIIKRYPEMYGVSLKEEMENYYTGDVKRNIVTLLETPRSENTEPDEQLCADLANALKDNPVSAWGLKDIFNEVFADKSADEILHIGWFYYRMTERTLIEEVEEKMTGRMQVLMKELLYGLINPSEYYAKKLRKEIKGIGVNTYNLDRIMISRYDVDMPLIRRFYLQLYGVKLSDELLEQTTGVYKNILLKLCQNMKDPIDPAREN